MADSKEIKRIIAGSELRDMADYLTNPENAIGDAIFIYQTSAEVGYRILGGSSIATLIGLTAMASDDLRNIADEMLNPKSE